MEDKILTAIWDRLPGETDKAWEAFRIYRDMPLFGPKTEKRSLQNLMDIIGHTSMGTTQMWSVKYRWQARCRAYDSYKGIKADEFRQVALQEYQENLISRSSQQVAAMDEVIDNTLSKLMEQADALMGKADSVEAVESLTKAIERMVRAMKEKDSLARRNAKMPTTYRDAAAEQLVEEEEQVFIVKAPNA